MNLLLVSLVVGMPTTEGTLVFNGTDGPGKGKHVVLLAGDEEYRSEEMLPQLAQILSKRHGFTCTVGFSLNDRGEIDPNSRTIQTGLEALKTADLCIIMLRFRRWPDAHMKKFVDFYLSGKPIMALRTSTHAFDYPADSSSAYKAYGWRDKSWPGGFGKQVLGETWVSHWGAHGSQATRALPVSSHSILNGVGKPFVLTDVYEASPPNDAELLMRGQVVEGMRSDCPPSEAKRTSAQGDSRFVNFPKAPVVWLREPENAMNRRNKIMTCTMGSATDLVDDGFRRLLVNGTYWLTGKEVPKLAEVGIVAPYMPSPYGFEGFRKGVKPSELEVLKAK